MYKNNIFQVKHIVKPIFICPILIPFIHVIDIYLQMLNIKFHYIPIDLNNYFYQLCTQCYNQHVLKLLFLSAGKIPGGRCKNTMGDLSAFWKPLCTQTVKTL